MNPNDPHARYGELLTRHQQTAGALRERERRISRARMATFVASLAILLAGSELPWLPMSLALLPAAAFIALIWHHDTVIRSRERAERAAEFYRRGLARLEEQWADSGETGQRFLDQAHPYAIDLDIFGPGSLFQFLSTARTRVGEETLAAWLSQPAGPNEVRRRQHAVAELAGRLELREDLAVVSASVALHPEKLREWSAATALAASRNARILAAAIAATTSATIALAALGGSPLPLVIVILVQCGFAWYWRRTVHRICADAERTLRDLGVLSLLLARLERESFECEALRRLRDMLNSEGLTPSQLIHQLRRRVDFIDARRNELFAPIAALLLWTTQWALAIEAWRHQHAGAIAQWLTAIGEIEALSALAAYCFEHPEDVFAELVLEGARFDATGLGHPLIGDRRNVRNDARLDSSQRLLIVSGSNMSGKSTLLRAIGVNLVMALAGAPVRARQLTLTPLTLGASIRVVDSLQTGTSRFYAEIKRLRQLVELSGGEVALLFLLDEVLSGTNSHDRRAGAEAVARSLIARGSIGLLTTHDLALAQLASTAELHAVNVHFEDTLEDGEMHFDYRLRPGVVQKSNALELMRAVGLDV